MGWVGLRWVGSRWLGLGWVWVLVWVWVWVWFGSGRFGPGRAGSGRVESGSGSVSSPGSGFVPGSALVWAGLRLETGTTIIFLSEMILCPFKAEYDYVRSREIRKIFSPRP